jgi:hypothetical protein
MVCKRCAFDNHDRFNGEIAIHFPVSYSRRRVLAAGGGYLCLEGLRDFPPKPGK